MDIVPLFPSQHRLNVDLVDRFPSNGNLYARFGCGPYSQSSRQTHNSGSFRE